MKTTQEYLSFAKDWLIKQGSSLNYTNHSLGARMLEAWDKHQTNNALEVAQTEKEELVEFNLEEALQEPERVRFRNGETPLEWHYFASLSGGICPIVAIANNTKIHTTKNGYQVNKNEETNYDLMLVKKKEVVWFGLYKDKHGVMYTTDVQNTKEEVEEYIDGRKLLKFYSYEE